MSDIIHLLPDSVANQIAAGEVIQRPASVIKELVENALDAGATHIQVVVEDAGKTLVQVVDNGCGMSDTDARLSFERHATSKIQQATDLFALRTMGFRGEALASIAAVAQVELRTKQQGKDLGTSICIEGAKVTCQEPVACPAGANFAVRNLFFNIPARRKFLKSNQTELANITSEFERIALAHPDIAFTLHSGGSVMLDLPGGNFRQRIVGIFGRRIDKHLVPVEVDTTLAHISGFVGMPAAARRKNAHQYLFVNGRFMRHPYFAKAILTAYERLIPDGQQVPFFINFEVDPARIDVNIHPTKTEIKFEDDSAIFQILLAAVRESLGKYGAVPAIDFNTEGRPDIPTFNNEFNASSAPIAPPTIHVNTAFNPFDTGSQADASSNDFAPHGSDNPSAAAYRTHHPAPAPLDWQQIYENAQRQAAQQPQAANQGEATIEIESHYNNESSASDTMSATPDALPQPSDNALYNNLPLPDQNEWQAKSAADLLQYNGRYIVTGISSGLALIDQHKAHMRILYERYIKQQQAHKAPSQQMLFPEPFTTSPSEGIVLEQIMPQLKEVGFDITTTAPNTYEISGTPVGTEGLSPTALVTSILTDAIAGQADAAATIGHIIALALARKVAMPVGQYLTTTEMSELIGQLFSCESPAITPDGAPTMIIINPEKMF